MQKSDDLKEYEEEKRPFDDVMRQLIKAKPKDSPVKKKTAVKKPKPKKK